MDELPYRKEDGVTLIEMRLTTVQQLFNSLDPTPFPEKDLDAEAETYVVSSVREWPLGTPLKLVFHLPARAIGAGETAGLPDAIHNYFAYRLTAARRDLKFQMEMGRIAFLIGLAFLVVCVGLRQIIATFGSGVIYDIVAESLLILGWVAMWRPIQMFLYDWWPLKRACAIYAKLMTIPVEVRDAQNAPPGALAPGP
ncbi:MAG: hypothetical protein WCF16_08510 [Alphaproteobacteria bacterium]